LARQTAREPDAKEAQRLMSMGEYWVELAEIEDRQFDSRIGDTARQPARRPHRVAAERKTPRISRRSMAQVRCEEYTSNAAREVLLLIPPMVNAHRA